MSKPAPDSMGAIKRLAAVCLLLAFALLSNGIAAVPSSKTIEDTIVIWVAIELSELWRRGH